MFLCDTITQTYGVWVPARTAYEAKSGKIEDIDWPDDPRSAVMLNVEDDPAMTVLYNGPVDRKDPVFDAAERKVKRVVDVARLACAESILFMYGIPSPPGPTHAAHCARGYRGLILHTDAVAPVVYYRGEDEEKHCERASWSRKTIDLMKLRKRGGTMPIIAVVSQEWGLDPPNDGKVLDPWQLAQQVAAARTLGADGLFVWTGSYAQLRRIIEKKAFSPESYAAQKAARLVFQEKYFDPIGLSYDAIEWNPDVKQNANDPTYAVSGKLWFPLMADVSIRPFLDCFGKAWSETA